MDQGLLSISPIDGRYYKKTNSFHKYFSEFACIKYRVIIELEYLKYLSTYKAIKKISPKEKKIFDQIVKNFAVEQALEVKQIENQTHHDVKAVEYWLRKIFHHHKLNQLSPYIHIGLTSDDVNNLVYGLMLKDFKEEVIEKRLNKVILELRQMIVKYKDAPFMARTHSQPAVPTTFGKEIGNFYLRLKKQQKKIHVFKFEGKLNGAVGLYNGLNLIYPRVDWLVFSCKFIFNFDLEPNLVTTQILPYDNWLEFFQIMILINGIFINFCQDFWMYVLLAEIKLKKEDDQVGSSTMPQKLNPIDFENAEGNLQLANSIFQFFETKLTSSRLQRDLTDSTVRRNFGLVLTHSVLGWESLLKGLKKCSLDQSLIKENLNSHWEVLSEAIQLYLRVKGDDKGYEKLKLLTQKKVLSKTDYLKILTVLKLNKNEKFLKLTPENYLGLSKKIINYLLTL